MSDRLFGERPQRLVPTAVAAFKAARKIPWGAKAVWVEDWILDRGPEASWISASNLAARLGMSRDNVEQHRRWLLSLGFYHVVRRSGAKSDGWVPTLPLGCPHRGTTSADVQATAAQIDALLNGSALPIEGTGVAPPAKRGVAQATRGGVAESAKRGVAQSATLAGSASLTQSLIQHPSEGQSLASLEDATRDGADAPKAEQEADESQPHAIDQRPRAELEADGWEKLRQKLDVKRKGSRALPVEERYGI